MATSGVSAFLACAPPPSDMFVPPPNAAVEPLVLQEVASGFTSPLQLVEDSSGRLLVIDQIGVVWALDAGGMTEILDLRDRMVRINSGYDERGLLGIALHPQHADNGRVYVNYNAPSFTANSTTVVAEFEFDADGRIDAATERVILEIDQPQSNHNGGHLVFGPDGMLYIASGDGGGANDVGVGHTPGLGNGQDLNTLLGKILRIDIDAAEPYAIPQDNPFIATPDARPEIWAYGFRNPWGMSFDSATGELFVADVGQNRFEEINIVERGGNYGWNIREGRACFDADDPNQDAPACSTAGLREPILVYPHEGADGGVVGISVIGGAVYRGAAVPALVGTYVFGDWSRSFTTATGSVFLGSVDDVGQWTMVHPTIDDDAGSALNGHVVGFGRDRAGELYVLTSRNSGPQGTTGTVAKIVPSSN